MEKVIHVGEKYEHNGWPSISRPDNAPPAGWNLSLITAQERIRNHQLSPTGKSIAFIKDSESHSDVFTLSLDGSWPARITTDRELVAYWDDEIPQWSPDGKFLAFGINSHVHIAPSVGGLPRKISDFTLSAWSPRWMPDSTHLILSTTRYDADQLILTDRDGTWPRPLTNSALGDHWDARPSPDGRFVVFTYRPFDDLNRLDVCLVDISNGEIRTVYGKPGTRTRDARWSPDGQWIGFISQEAGNDDLWLVKPNGDALHQATQLGYGIGQFAWSPDGKSILLTVNHDGALDLSILELSAGHLNNLCVGFGIHTNPNWSLNGSFITFEYESPVQSPDIYKIELSNKAIQQLTFSSLPVLSINKLIMPERIRYKSFDNLEIPAFLFRPDKPNGAAIVCPHGGPSAQYGFDWDIFVQYFIAKGYTVLAPNYRGSTGYGVEFEHANYLQWGKGDTQDCLYGAKYLNSLSGIDPARLAIMGGSYGGYMANCCLARDPEYLFACGISKYGDANVLSSWALCKRELRLYTEIFLGHPGKNRDAYLNGSPIHDVAKVQKPILLLHGLEDDTVPPEASEEWAAALRTHQKTFEYKTYANEPHGFLKRKNLLDAYTHIERFLDWYLLP